MASVWRKGNSSFSQPARGSKGEGLGCLPRAVTLETVRARTLHNTVLLSSEDSANSSECIAGSAHNARRADRREQPANQEERVSPPCDAADSRGDPRQHPEPGGPFEWNPHAREVPRKRCCPLLEQHPTVGGQARRSEFLLNHPQL